MKREVIVTGKTIEEAVEAAVRELGAHGGVTFTLSWDTTPLLLPRSGSSPEPPPACAAATSPDATES